MRTGLRKIRRRLPQAGRHGCGRLSSRSLARGVRGWWCGGGRGDHRGGQQPADGRYGGLLKDFKKKTDITAKFQFLPENDLRQRVTQDVSLNAGNFDIVMVGAYETPIWAQSQWLEPLDPFFEQMSEKEKRLRPRGHPADVAHLLSYEDQLYAIPFYGESSSLIYRTDLFEKAGIEMPERPTWEQVTGFAEELNGIEDGVSGIAMRGPRAGARTWQRSIRSSTRTAGAGTT